MSKPLREPLAPGAMLGVLGGGQLGRLFAQAAMQAGYSVTVLDPASSGPAAEVASQHICAAYDDPDALEQLAEGCDAVTMEFENVPAQSLRTLAQRVPVAPDAVAVEIAQDRVREKSFFSRHELPTNRYAAIENEEDLRLAFEQIGPEVILKTATLGYDGKGQRRCDSVDQAIEAFREFTGVRCILEQLVPLDCEVSVVLARDIHGQIETMPVAENIHRKGILDISIAPARVSDALTKQAKTLAKTLAERLGYVGVMAVEMFVSDGQLLINEIAPRPHNSGHFTLDATDVSQFDQQLRALCGLSVARVKQYQPVVMLNIMGELLLQPAFRWSELQALTGSGLHVYGKTQARVGRKMAHLNLIGDDPDQLLSEVTGIKNRWPDAFTD